MFKYDFDVPANKKIRLLVHTDCKNEADDQFALAHHLMTPKFIVQGIIAGHFDCYPQEYGKGNTVKASYDEIIKVMDLMDLSDQYPVAMGASGPLPDEKTPIPSAGAEMIIQEALKDSPLPLFVVFQGSLTDLASAYLLEPKIAEGMTAIWIGGGKWPAGGFEFNLLQDIHAANVVFRSPIPLWQIPINVYKQVAVSLAELQYRVKPCGEIGRYLFEQMVAFNDRLAYYQEWPHGESWGLGDQGTVTVLLEERERMNYDLCPAPRILQDMSYDHDHDQDNREIRVYHTLESRLTLDDFYAKLAINFK